MDTFEKRRLGFENRIAKLEKRIVSLKNSFSKNAIKCEASKDEDEIRWALVQGDCILQDIQRAERELSREVTNYAVFNDKQAEISASKSDIQMIPALESFLDNWRSSSKKYFLDEVSQVKPFINSISHIKWSMRNTELKNRFDVFVIELSLIHSDSERVERLDAFLDHEVENKRLDFFKRCKDVVGPIVDASGLRVGDNGSINGLVIGQNGRATVDTILAGGYNIQRLHFRVLVNLIHEPVLNTEAYIDDSIEL